MSVTYTVRKPGRDSDGRCKDPTRAGRRAGRSRQGGARSRQGGPEPTTLATTRTTIAAGWRHSAQARTSATGVAAIANGTALDGVRAPCRHGRAVPQIKRKDPPEGRNPARACLEAVAHVQRPPRLAPGDVPAEPIRTGS